MNFFQDSALLYLENTILTVFLWIGLWGSINIVMEIYCKDVFAQLFVYMIFIIVSFTLLRTRNHI